MVLAIDGAESAQSALKLRPIGVQKRQVFGELVFSIDHVLEQLGVLADEDVDLGLLHPDFLCLQNSELNGVSGA